MLCQHVWEIDKFLLSSIRTEPCDLVLRVDSCHGYIPSVGDFIVALGRPLSNLFQPSSWGIERPIDGEKGVTRSTVSITLTGFGGFTSLSEQFLSEERPARLT